MKIFMKKKSANANVCVPSGYSRPTNMTLLDYLQNTFPDIRGMWPESPDTGYTKEYIREKMERFLELLTYPNFGLEERLVYERSSFPLLSARQLWCGSAVFSLCRNGSIGSAIHEFMDCVDNYEEARLNERKISPDEHALYYGLATAIILSLNTQEQR